MWHCPLPAQAFPGMIMHGQGTAGIMQ
jgi:hypothetical protein